MTDLNTIKRRMIRQEIARRNVVDAEAVAAMLERATDFYLDGDLVAVDANGVARTGHGANPTLPLSDLVDEIAAKSPALFGAKTAPAKNIVLDPQAPGFSLTAATIAARNDPVIHEALMARLAPRPLKVF